MIHSKSSWQEAVKTYAASINTKTAHEIGGTGLAEALPDVFIGPMAEEPDFVFLHNATPDQVRMAWQTVRSGGMICGLGYESPPRDEVPEMFVMRAVAEALPLLTVGVGPNGLWFACKVGE